MCSARSQFHSASVMRPRESRRAPRAVEGDGHVGMDRAEVLLLDGQGPLEERLSVGLLVVGHEIAGQRFQAGGQPQVLGTGGRFEHGDGLLVSGPGLGGVALRCGQAGQMLQADGHGGVTVAQRRLAEREGLSKYPPRRLRSRLEPAAQRRDAVEAGGHARVRGAEGVPADGQRPLVELEGFGVASGGGEHVAQIVQGDGHFGMVGAEGGLADGQRGLVEGSGFAVPPQQVVDVRRGSPRPVPRPGRRRPGSCAVLARARSIESGRLAGRLRRSRAARPGRRRCPLPRHARRPVRLQRPPGPSRRPRWPVPARPWRPGLVASTARVFHSACDVRPFMTRDCIGWSVFPSTFRAAVARDVASPCCGPRFDEE